MYAEWKQLRVRGPVDIGRAVLLLFALILTGFAAIQLTSSQLAHGGESVQRRLAKFYLYDDARLTRSAVNYLINPQKPDAIAATGIYLALLERDSASPDRWCDLGDALVSAGQTQKAERSFKRAVQLAP